MAPPTAQPQEPAALELARLHARLAALAALETHGARVAAATALLCELTNALACVAFARRGAELEARPAWSAPANAPHADVETLADLARSACAAGRLEALSLAQPRPATALATPFDGGNAALVLVLVLGRAAPESYAAILQLAAALLDAASSRPQGPQGLQGADLSALLGAVAASPDAGSAAFAVADALAAASGAAHVAIVLGDPPALRALSGVPEVDHRASLAADLAAAAAPSVRSGRQATWPDAATRTGDPLETAARQLGAQAAWTLALRSAAGATVGAALFFAPALPASPGALQTAADVAGTALDAHARARRSPLSAWRRLGPARRRIAGAALMLLAAAMFVPVPHTLLAPVVIEPESRRYVAAPFEAMLAATQVRAGDRVQQGDVLATLDGRVIELELAQLAAEREKASRSRDVALAQGDSAQSQIAGLEVARIDARAQLLAARRGQIEIRAPVDGVVVQGELAREQGSPVQTGQRLFEIAPLGRMVAELYVPAADVPHFRDGMTASVAVAGLGGRTWTQRVERLHPRAVLHENRSAFLAEITLDNTAGVLKPGMRGEANLDAGRRALGWVLFHRAGERVLAWLR